MSPVEASNGDGSNVNGNAANGNMKSVGSAKQAGIAFWASLSGPIQVIVQPYLRELFDMRKHAIVFGEATAGDYLTAASFLVWDKVKGFKRKVLILKCVSGVDFLCRNSLILLDTMESLGHCSKRCARSFDTSKGLNLVFSYALRTAVGLEKKSGESANCSRLWQVSLNKVLTLGLQIVLAVVDTLRLKRDECCQDQAVVFANKQIMTQENADSIQNGRFASAMLPVAG